MMLFNQYERFILRRYLGRSSRGATLFESGILLRYNRLKFKKEMHKALLPIYLSYLALCRRLSQYLFNHRQKPC